MAKNSSFDPAAILGLKQKPAKKPFPKKAVLIVIASLAGSLLLAASVWLLYFEAQFSVYQDSQYKFSIKYPKTWRVVIHPQVNVAVVFLRPKDTALDTLQENFNVTIQAMPEDIYTLEAFSARVKTQIMAVLGKNTGIVEDKSIHWSWREGHEIVLAAPKPDHLKMVNAWVLAHDQAYILTFLGDMRKYAKDSPVVDRMIHSLQIQ